MTMEFPLLPLDQPAPPARERGSLYRAYRSLTFAEVVGQQAVTQTLCNAVRYGKVTHAYLFTGPRGTGKTSTARILARAVNCLQPRDGEPCNACEICVSMLERRSLDLVEIDGASNNSVDDVRELIARVNFRPAAARRKVFIIDEVHMLSIGAFNALLKTLEEPPEHVLFLLATTEVHKVPATITSRCQLFNLKPILVPEMAQRLRYVCAQEGIQADDDVLAFVATQGTGSLRDALSLLEQIRAYCGDALHLPEVEAALGLARAGQVALLADAMAAGDLATALSLVGEMMAHGLDPRQLARQLTEYWRDALYGRARRQLMPEPHVAPLQSEQITQILRSLLSIESLGRRSDSPRWALELAIAEATLALAPRRGDVAASLVSVPPSPPAMSGLPPRAPVSSGPDSAGPPLPAVHVAADGASAAAGTAPRSGVAERHTAPERATAAERPSAPERSAAAAPLAQNQTALFADSAASAGPRSLAPMPVGEDPVIRPDTIQTPVPDGDVPVRDDASAGGPPLYTGSSEPPPGPSYAVAEPITAPVAFVDERREDGARLSLEEARARWPLLLRWLSEHQKGNIKGYLGATTAQGLNVEGTTLIIGFPAGSGIVRAQLERPTNRSVLEQAIKDVYGSQWTLRYATIDGLTPPPSIDALDEEVQYFEQELRRARRGDG